MHYEFENIFGSCIVLNVEFFLISSFMASAVCNVKLTVVLLLKFYIITVIVQKFRLNIYKCVNKCRASSFYDKEVIS